MTLAAGEDVVDENFKLRSKLRCLEARLASMISPPASEITKEVLSSDASNGGGEVTIPLMECHPL